jgi:hypothetical protein
MVEAMEHCEVMGAGTGVGKFELPEGQKKDILKGPSTLAAGPIFVEDSVGLKVPPPWTVSADKREFVIVSPRLTSAGIDVIREMSES